MVRFIGVVVSIMSSLVVVFQASSMESCIYRARLTVKFGFGLLESKAMKVV